MTIYIFYMVTVYGDGMVKDKMRDSHAKKSVTVRRTHEKM